MHVKQDRVSMISSPLWLLLLQLLYLGAMMPQLSSKSFSLFESISNDQLKMDSDSEESDIEEMSREEYVSSVCIDFRNRLKATEEDLPNQEAHIETEPKRQKVFQTDVIKDQQAKRVLKKARVRIKANHMTKYPKKHYKLFKQLLDKLSQHAASHSNPKTPFSRDDRFRLQYLLQTPHSVEELLKHYIIERVKLAAIELFQWKVPHLEELGKLLRKRYQIYRMAILSEDFASMQFAEAWVSRAPESTKDDHLFGDCFEKSTLAE